MTYVFEIIMKIVCKCPTFYDFVSYFSAFHKNFNALELRHCMPLWLQFLVTYFQTQKNLPIFTTFDWWTRSAMTFFENNEKKTF